MNIKIIKRQQGAALAIGLILLLVITLMGYTGMKGTMLQEKMAAGLHNKSLAAIGTHSALREGEAYLYNLVENTNGVAVQGTPAGSLSGIYSFYQTPGEPLSGDNNIAAAFKNNDWSAAGGTETAFSFTGVTELGAALSDEPQYIIQHIRETSKVPSAFGGYLGIGGGTQEFGAGSGGGSPGTTGIQDTYLVTAKSRSGDGNSYAINETVYTVVSSSSPTN